MGACPANLFTGIKRRSICQGRMLYYIIAPASEIFLPHSHAHRHATPVEPGFSLLRLSAAERLAGVGVVAALLWLAVWWAL